MLHLETGPIGDIYLLIRVYGPLGDEGHASIRGVNLQGAVPFDLAPTLLWSGIVHERDYGEHTLSGLHMTGIIGPTARVNIQEGILARVQTVLRMSKVLRRDDLPVSKR